MGGKIDPKYHPKKDPPPKPPIKKPKIGSSKTKAGKNQTSSQKLKITTFFKPAGVKVAHPEQKVTIPAIIPVLKCELKGSPSATAVEIPADNTSPALAACIECTVASATSQQIQTTPPLHGQHASHQTQLLSRDHLGTACTGTNHSLLLSQNSTGDTGYLDDSSHGRL